MKCSCLHVVSVAGGGAMSCSGAGLVDYGDCWMPFKVIGELCAL